MERKQQKVILLHQKLQNDAIKMSQMLDLLHQVC